MHPEIYTETSTDCKKQELKSKILGDFFIGENQTETWGEPFFAFNLCFGLVSVSKHLFL